MLTAWKRGYFNGGALIGDIDDETDVQIKLAALYESDNQNYKWVDPSPNPDDDIKNCGDCHASFIYDQWSHNGHFQSATNPRFLNIYNGTDSHGNTEVLPGYRIDYPYSNGNCSNCHAPAAAVRDFVGVDMNALQGVEKLGVSCDFCHKIKGIHIEEDPNVYTGVMQIDLLRPPDGHQIFFGPFDDVPDPDTFSPVISQSAFCAPCHRGSYWGVPIYESYSEWLASPYAKQGVTCQKCHMPPDGVTNNFAPGHGGLPRDPNAIPRHLQAGSRDSTFLASAVEMRAHVAVSDQSLSVRVEIENVGAGHHVPTDQPMRNMILLVKAEGANGRTLRYVGENRVPYWGGRGPLADGNYAEQPGKGFAKILAESYPIYSGVKGSKKGRPVFPAPQWRMVHIEEDTRIPAMATDRSAYEFRLDGSEFPITVTCKLIYRRAFKSWETLKKWQPADVVLAQQTNRITGATH